MRWSPHALSALVALASSSSSSASSSTSSTPHLAAAFAPGAAGVRPASSASSSSSSASPLLITLSPRDAARALLGRGGCDDDSRSLLTLGMVGRSGGAGAGAGGVGAGGGGGGAGGGGFLGQEEGRASDDDEDDEDEDSDDEDEDDDDDLSSRRRRRLREGGESSAAFAAGLKLDPYDPHPPIKPRPGRYGFGAVDAVDPVPDSDLVQTMTADERRENLDAMRQIKKFDLADLRLRKDHAGWVEANGELKRRTAADPWYGLNDRLREATQMGEEEEAERLKGLISKVGGPPPGIDVGPRGYALHTEIFDVGMSSSRAASMLEQEIIDDRVRRGRAMAAEARANQEKARRRFEEKMRGGGDNTEEREAKERRERMMRRLMGELEEDRKKREERAKELLGKMPDMPEDIASSFDRALREAREDVRRQRRRERLGAGASSDDDDDGDDADSGAARTSGKSSSSAARAREQAAADASGGRPRLPGDPDVTRGEIAVPIEESSVATSGPLTVEVRSNYNAEQSDPPMRKHCFQYTIRITNNSPTDTVQLISRRFEIQTVGSSMKDVVQGEGVTGRQPVLKPGEVFEYTSTAPLSVRPIGTTEIAARMRGEYRYVTLRDGQETAEPEQVRDGGDGAAELGTFHFVFPEEQRVRPVRAADAEDDDDDDEEEEDEDAPAGASSTAAAAAAAARPAGAAPVPKDPSSPASASAAARAGPTSTLPGDRDMETGDVRPSDPNVDESSDTVTDGVRVRVAASYKPERSDSSLDKHCFQYNIRITNENADRSVQLVSRRFEIQTIGSPTKDVVQGPGVTGRQPVLRPGESFEYNSTAPLSVRPMLDRTPVVARMEGEYNFVVLGEDGQTPVGSGGSPLQAKLGRFHFILPALDVA